MALLALCAFSAFSQTTKQVNINWNEVPKANVAFLGTPQIQASNYKVYQIDVDNIKNQMVGVMHREQAGSGFIAEVSFPHPDGSMHAYTAKENSTMHPTLGALFPETKTYDGHGSDGTFIKWDITPHGFHAMIMIPGQSTIFIDPLIKGNDDYYIVYSKKDFITDKLADCQFNSDNAALNNPNAPVSGIVKSFGTCELRTYRIAISATGEYTTFHGGTVAQAAAAQVTTMNRVNGVYERDMAITMVIIANNNNIIYTNAGSDPFTNGAPGTMINENQTNTDNVIGNGNYDIGHVFGTNSGGLAGLGVVCNNSQKARGVTGSGAPIGDPFDIDYVAHEIGHQFGANHTFNNSCSGNRNNATAMEPGSGSSIMAYAGICPPNVQNNSDDHFHGISLEEIGFEITSAGHTCEAITPLANSAPILVSTNANVTVPANTPFALTAVANDPDGDPMTYNWEQMNNDITTQAPLANATGGPNFRSLPSSTSPTRYFPNLTDLNAGGPFTWEVLPSVSRTMDFRVTVRDNSSGAGGCNDHADVTITTDAGSGPFVVNYPSNTGIVWTGVTTETVTWSVAGTDVAPVACANVDILLSTDGGLTFPTVLATNVPNDGSETITVPNTATTQAIVMVICSNGTFFDISDNVFEITAATFDYTLAATPASVSICQPSDAVYTVDIGAIGGYSDAVNLSVSGVPAGATSNFSTNPVTPVGQSTLTISNTGSAAPGSYTLTITAVSTSGTKTENVTLDISTGTPSAVTQLTPANGALSVSVPTTFTWTTAPEAGVTYEIDIASDAGFATIVDQATGLATATYTSTLLAPSTMYYWRVRSATGCGSSAWSSAFDFTTNSCATFASTDIPVAISASGTPTITSTITVPSGGLITDINVLNVNGTHTYVSDLTVTLTSPAGTTEELWAGICTTDDDFNLNFDDGAAAGAIPCPPTGGGTHQPTGTLANFNGEDQAGVWTLTISDAFNQDGGSLDGWSLEICTAPCVAPSAVTQIAPANGATALTVPVNFTWTTAPEAGVTYEIDIATDAGFATIVDQATGLAAAAYSSGTLLGGTTYYWRVRSVTPCGTAAWSSTFDFTTEAITCNTFVATTIPVAISATGTPTITSTITVPSGGTITDVNVLNVNGTHTYVSDLTVTLTSPAGTNIELWSAICTTDDDFNLNFDDAAAAGAIPCPPTGGGTHQPTVTLANFNGEDQAGVWTLTISDAFNQDGGSLDGWSLEICVAGAAGCTDPDIPTLAGTTTICPGTPTTLSIASGNLNDAADWQWYTGSCGGASAGSGTSITVSPGTTTTYFVRGEGGCVTPSSCASITVNAEDNVAPVVTCPGNQVENFNASCQFTLPDYTVLGMATDNCDASPTIVQTPAAGTVVTGNTTITFSSTDASGNTGTCTFDVVPNDATAPIISCPGNQVENADASCQLALPDYTSLVTATDNCGTPTVTQSPAPGTIISGATTITMTASDGVNTTSCTFTVSLNDVTAPTISCPGNQTENANASCEIVLPDYTGSVTTSDACDASPVVMQSPAPGTTVTGVTTVTMTSTDASGNASTCTFTVTPVDVTAPTISCPGNQTENANASCEIVLADYTGSVTTLDACDASPVVTQSPAPGTTVTGVTTVTMTSTDASGNANTCTFTVTPVDVTAPTISCPGNQTENANASCEIVLPDYTGSVTTSDACDASPVVTQSPAPGTTVTGVTTVTMTSTDASGNVNTCTFTVTPVDVTAPTISCPGNQTENANASCEVVLPDYTGSVTTSDACDASPVVTQSPAPGTTVTGVTTVTMTSTDASGNANTCTFTVTPVDVTAPTISCPGNQTENTDASCQATLADYTALGTASDACDAAPVITQSPAPGTTISAVTTVTLTATDASGNSSTCTFTVTPVDVTAPVITCPGDQTSCLSTMEDYTSLATAADNCDASPVITQSPAPGSAVSGSFVTVVLTATDADGNSSTCSFLVTLTSYNVNQNVTICDGEPYFFPDGTPGTTSQTYTSVLTTSGGCDSTIVTNLTVEAPIDESVTVSGITITSNETNASATYQWIDCDNSNLPIAGETGQSFTPSTPTGNYAVVVTVGSCSDTSVCTLIDYSSLDEHAAQHISIYPNPTSSNVTIEWEGEINAIEVTDAKGKLVRRVNDFTGNSYQLELTEYSSGVYFIHIESEHGRTVHDLMKQ